MKFPLNKRIILNSILGPKHRSTHNRCITECDVTCLCHHMDRSSSMNHFVRKTVSLYLKTTVHRSSLISSASITSLNQLIMYIPTQTRVTNLDKVYFIYGYQLTKCNIKIQNSVRESLRN